jgi:hypothetical protein
MIPAILRSAPHDFRIMPDLAAELSKQIANMLFSSAL